MNIDPATACVCLMLLKIFRTEYFPGSSVLALFVKAPAGGSASQGGGDVGETFLVASDEQRGAWETSMMVWSKLLASRF